jgi:hypothetical protein
MAMTAIKQSFVTMAASLLVTAFSYGVLRLRLKMPSLMLIALR